MNGLWNRSTILERGVRKTHHKYSVSFVRHTLQSETRNGRCGFHPPVFHAFCYDEYMNKTTLQLNITDLLSKRLDAWDQIDQAYDEGLFVKALKLTEYVEKTLNPQIKEAYGL